MNKSVDGLIDNLIYWQKSEFKNYFKNEQD